MTEPDLRGGSAELDRQTSFPISVGDQVSDGRRSSEVDDFGSAFAPYEDPLPRFGLVDCEVRHRQIDEEGWDLVRVVNRFEAGRAPDVMVGVIRRATAQRVGQKGRITVPERLARNSVATVLALSQCVNGQEVVDVAAEIGLDDAPWHERQFVVDGQSCAGWESRYKAMRIAYVLTELLIIYVLADETWNWTAPLELKKLRTDEVMPRAQ